MITRKIISFGKSSLIVSLPKEWLQQNNIQKGDEVFIDFNTDRLTVSKTDTTNTKPEKKCIIDASEERSIAAIRRDICAKYINNFNIIEIRGKNIKIYSNEIKEYLRTFMVFEIMDEDTHHIIAKDFLDLNSMDAEDIIIKMYLNIKSVFQDIKKPITSASYDNLTEKEIQINSYFFFMQRFFRHNLDSGETKKNILILFDYWQTAFYLEDIANPLVRIVLELHRGKIKLNKDILKIIEHCENYFVENLDAFFKRDKKKMFEIAEHRPGIIKSIDLLRTNENKVFLDQFMLLVQRTHKASRILLGL